MSLAHSAPDRLLDLDDRDALPLDEVHRVELVDGVLLVSPRPQFGHQDVVLRVATALRAGLPPSWPRPRDGSYREADSLEIDGTTIELP